MHELNGLDETECVSVEIVRDDSSKLPAGVCGLLIYVANGSSINTDISKIVAEALETDIPILGSATGMHMLNVALGGDPAGSTPKHEQSKSGRNSIFLAPGAKTSSTIGGSGWLSINCDHKDGIAQSGLAPGAMASAMADDRIVEAFEMPGHRWVLGVQWDVFGATRLPRGFDNVWLAFIERVEGK